MKNHIRVKEQNATASALFIQRRLREYADLSQTFESLRHVYIKTAVSDRDTELQYLVVLSNADYWEEHHDKWKQCEHRRRWVSHLLSEKVLR